MDYYEGSGTYDREAVRFFDVAHEGAQLRAVAQAADRLERLAGLQPRSVVVLATDHIASVAARAVSAFYTPLEVPVVVARKLPGYVGALDLVVVVGDADREEDARGLIAAAGRGAETVLAGPHQGQLLHDAPASTLIIPALPTAAGPSPARTIAVVGAVLRCLTRPVDVVAEKLELLADDVDAEVARLSPEHDETVNPARQLRIHADGAQVLHTGGGSDWRTGELVAQLAAALWSARGIACGFVEAEELASALERVREAGGSGAGESPRPDDIFYDPFIDGPQQLVGLKTIVWACGDAGAATAPDTRVEIVAAGSEGAGSGPVDPAAQALRLITRAYAATALDPS